MIKTIYEGKRGCGFRKEGGLYLFSDGIFFTCGMMPIPLTICPCCNQGIKPARGFTWISPRIWENQICKSEKCKHCDPFFDDKLEKVGLMWVGNKFYTTEEFLKEGMQMGVSKRIAQVPKDFVVGETWVLLAHRKPTPHIFCAFKPTEIQYVVKDDDTEEDIERKTKRGITPVRVVNRDPLSELPFPERSVFHDKTIQTEK